MMSHWITTAVGDFDINDYMGFVYLVTNLSNNKKYIGKKQFWSSGKKQIRNKKNEGTHTQRILTESDWKTYTTSSKQVNSAITGGDQFKFEIISLHYDKGSLAYAEVEAMVYLDVLRSRFTDGTRQYYNAHIPGVKWIPIARTTVPDDVKKKISNSMIGNKNSAKKRPPLTTEHKAKLSLAMKNNHNGKKLK